MPTVIVSDKDMYSIILQNLLENSIKYTFTGKVEVVLSFDEQDNTLTTEVTDTGIGMTDQQQHNIGLLFKRSRIQTQMNPQGLGLGLFLAKTLAQQLEGDLMLESTIDKGTTASFTIKNDLLQSPGSLSIGALQTGLYYSIKQPESPMNFNTTCKCTKILLVDDEPFNLLVFSAYLKGVKAASDKAVNGKIALDLIMEKAEHGKCCKGYSIIFMDINMPVMDGIQSTVKIAELAKDGKIPNCRVVAVTAAAGLDKPEVYNGYIAKGFTELLSKPVQKADFLRILGKYLNI